MKKILFVCHGNICRSPMAEYVMRHLVTEAGCDTVYLIDSAATSAEELGNPVYPPVRKKLAEHNIACGGHKARQICHNDYDYYDLIIGMDKYNMQNMYRFFGDDPQGKLHILSEYSDIGHDVADPWYTRDFETTYSDVLAGCTGLFQFLS